ncbi:LuxR C-terminal-related transcriptional regulator [Nonomuraea sp. CA-143628]|uniref:LuxR C-terminal-related transcriptional regulator n=1 Tax=Nonomuraea sp. CA-143628 TaxID=3239997 RepID=UPI003D92B219
MFITNFDLDEYVHAALGAGARGLPLKDAAPDLLAQAVRAAADGDALIALIITARLLQTFAYSGRAMPPAQPREALIGREKEILATVARGRTSSEIADAPHISLSTVKSHIARLMLNCSAASCSSCSASAIVSRSPCGRTRPSASGSDRADRPGKGSYFRP